MLLLLNFFLKAKPLEDYQVVMPIILSPFLLLNALINQDYFSVFFYFVVDFLFLVVVRSISEAMMGKWQNEIWKGKQPKQAELRDLLLHC